MLIWQDLFFILAVFWRKVKSGFYHRSFPLFNKSNDLNNFDHLWKIDENKPRSIQIQFHMFYNNTVCNRFNKGCKCKQQKTKNSVSDFYAVSVMCSFSLDPTSFVLGSETGGVFKCSFNHTPNSRIVHSQFSFSIYFSSFIQLTRSSRISIFIRNRWF